MPAPIADWRIMSKSKLTNELELKLLELFKYKAFCCPEVTIGWYGKERVDFMTYDTEGIFRCFEVKSSKEDFYSKAKHTFVGHYGYYVMPLELYDIVKGDIPKHIGCYVLRNGDMYSIKKSAKQKLPISKTILYESFIRSLYRESLKYLSDGRDMEIKNLKSENNKAKKEFIRYKDKYMECEQELRVYRRFIINEHGLNVADNLVEMEVI